MAELIITEEEKHSKIFLDWDDSSLGKATKKIACILGDKDGKHGINYTAACVFLISESIKANSYNTVINLEGCFDGEEQLGDWKITLGRLNNDIR